MLLALIHRAKTGRGQWLDVSQFESLSSLLETLLLDMSANGPAAASTRAGNRLPHGGGAPHGAYRCLGEDRWMAISIFSDEEWRAFGADPTYLLREVLGMSEDELADCAIAGVFD